MTTGMAYTAGHPGAQGIYQTAHHPLVPRMAYPPSIKQQMLDENPPLSSGMLRLYPLCGLSLSSARHFDKRGPFVVLILLAAHDIDFEYAKMVDISRQLPERHPWLRTSFEANITLKP